MKSRKLLKQVSGFVAMTVVASMVLAGCGAKSENPAPTSTTSTSTSTVDAVKELAPYELTYYYPGAIQPDQEVVANEVNRLLKEKINATIKLNVVDFGQYSNKMKIVLAAGDPVDVCFTAHWANTYAEQVGKSSFNELGELLTNFGTDIKKQVPESWWPAVTIKNKIYGVPNIQFAATTPGIYVRKDLADKYKLDPNSINSIADIEPFLAAVKNGEKDVYPIELTKQNHYFGNQITLPKGYLTVGTYGMVNMNGDKYKVENFYASDIAKDYLKLVSKWYKAGYTLKDGATKDDTTAERKAGKFAVTFAGNVAPYEANKYKDQYGVEVYAIDFKKSIMDTNSIAATLNAIPVSSNDPQRAMMFLNLLYSDKQLYTTLTNGVEGTHYTKVADNVIDVPKDSKYNSGTGWLFGNVFNGFITKGSPDDMLQKQAEGNAKAIASPLLGFSFDTTPVKTEVAQIGTSDALSQGLATGNLDYDKYYQKLMDEMNGAGLDKYLAELQKQIDEWKTANGK